MEGICTDMSTDRRVLTPRCQWVIGGQLLDSETYFSAPHMVVVWRNSAWQQSNRCSRLCYLKVFHQFVSIYRNRVRRRRTLWRSSASASSAWTSAWVRVVTDWPELPKCWSSSQGRLPSSPKVCAVKWVDC